MAFIPVPLTAQVELRFDYFGQKVENTLYFASDSPATQASLTQLAQGILTWWIDNMRGNVSTDVLLREVYVTDLSAADAVAVTFPAPENTRGAVTNAGLPGNVALCVSFRTTGRGRSARGRNYVFGLAEQDVTANFVDPSRAESIRFAYQQLVGSFVSGHQWVIVSRYADGAPRPNGITRGVTAVVLTDNFVDSQRRRLQGRGR